jgi:hypothetical protein
MHTKIYLLIVLAPALLMVGGQAAAQANPCKTEVVKFEEAIGLIRQVQGNEAAAKLKEKLLPAKTEAQLLATEGYCGVAKYIRDNKLNR